MALNSVGQPAAVQAAVFASGETLSPPNIPTDVYVVDNPTGGTVTIGGASVLPHSVYVAVVGGDDQAIAQAIWAKKDLGCDYNGNTTKTVQDTSNYNPPYPSYSVTFERPTELAIYMAVSIVNDPLLPSDIISQIRSAVIGAFAGQDGGPVQRIGNTVYASRFYSPILVLSPRVHVLALAVGSAPAPSTSSQSVNINQYPTILATNIAVTLV